MCDEPNFVRSAAVGCITVPSAGGQAKWKSRPDWAGGLSFTLTIGVEAIARAMLEPSTAAHRSLRKTGDQPTTPTTTAPTRTASSTRTTTARRTNPSSVMRRTRRLTKGPAK